MSALTQTKQLDIEGDLSETLLPTMRSIADREKVLEWVACPEIYEALLRLIRPVGVTNERISFGGAPVQVVSKTALLSSQANYPVTVTLPSNRLVYLVECE